MNDILKALERNEDIKICYRGKIKGTIKSMLKTQSKTKKVCDHPFFNCLIDDESVEEQMNRIRGGRYNMNKKMTWNDMKTKFPDEWLLITDFDLDKSATARNMALQKN